MLSESDVTESAVEDNRATFSCEDGKLRLYLADRVSRESYLYLRSNGFVATPKQECSFVAPWSVRAEDICLELIPDDADIEDEDYSPAERAADRAERFSGYRDKRRAEAGSLADRYESGSAVYGSQNASRAERMARRRDRCRGGALTQWGKAEYWQMRTQGVIEHALYQMEPGVRRARLLRLESEMRKLQKRADESLKGWNAWRAVAAETDADKQRQMVQAIFFSPGYYGHAEYPHPDNPEVSRSLWSLCDAEAMARFDLRVITPGEAAAMRLADYPEAGPAAPGSVTDRWLRHYEQRIAYERSMIAAEGGMAADVEMEAGGWLGKWQIQKVNKSPATKRVVSVQLAHWFDDHEIIDGQTVTKRVMKRKTVNIERLGSDVYRSPTDEERGAFKAEQAEAKKAAKAGKVTISLINPTPEDAARLQEIWNAAELADAIRKLGPSGNARCKSAEVIGTTQATYSAASKGSYAQCETRTLYADGRLSRKVSNMWTKEGHDYDSSLPQPVAQVRILCSNDWYKAPSLIVLTDKPQKPLPLDFAAIAAVGAESVTA